MGVPTLQGGRQHTILPNFPKNCMKLKEFGPRGGRASKILLCRSATGMSAKFLTVTLADPSYALVTHSRVNFFHFHTDFGKIFAK